LPKKGSKQVIFMPEAETPKKRTGRRKLLLLSSLVVLIGGVVGLVLWNSLASRQFARQLAESEPVDADARYRGMVIGTWEDEYQGKRTMTLNKDGTGTMVVELSGWRAALSASRLKFKMRWSVKDGHLKKQTVSGEPEAQVKMILSTMGDHVDEPILELTKDRLLLLDQDGNTKYDWKRKAP
jgi:hypothetical protein